MQVDGKFSTIFKEHAHLVDAIRSVAYKGIVEFEEKGFDGLAKTTLAVWDAIKVGLESDSSFEELINRISSKSQDELTSADQAVKALCHGFFLDMVQDMENKTGTFRADSTEYVMHRRTIAELKMMIEKLS